MTRALPLLVVVVGLGAVACGAWALTEADPIREIWAYETSSQRLTVTPTRGTDWTSIGLVAVGGALLIYGWEFSFRRRVWPLALACTLLTALGWGLWWAMHHPPT